MGIESDNAGVDAADSSETPFLTPSEVARKMTASLAFFPALGAIVLGLAYVLGSTWKISQLHHSGLNLDDTFTRIPLQEILSEGIGIEVLASALVPGLATMYIATRVIEDRLSRKPERPLPAHLSRVLRILAIVTATAVMLWLPWPVVVFVLVGSSVFAALAATRGRPLSPFEQILAYTALTPVLLVASAFVFPHPLPEAHVRTTDGHLIVGPLITISDGSWVIGRRHPVGFAAVPLSEVASATAITETDSSDRRLYRLIESIF